MSIRWHLTLNRLAIIGGWLFFGIAAIIAVYFAIAAQRLYEQRAALKLEPIYVDRFAATNATLTWTAKTRVVIFGDSRIVQWNPLPPAFNTQFVLRGVVGETVTQMRYRFERDVLNLKPTIVVIQAGINDLVAAGAMPRGERSSITDKTFSNLRTFIELSRKDGIRVIIATVVRPGAVPIWRRFFWSNSILNQVERLNKNIRSLAGDGIQILDADKLLTNGTLTINEAYSADTLHFTQSGYRKLDEALMVILEQK